MNSDPLEPAADFSYLVHTVSYNNRHWEALYKNLRKARRQRGGMVEKVVKKMVATVWARGMLYKELVQTVMLYGSESWVATGSMLKLLE